MLVDLGRNDLQRVCRAGTVDVVEFMNVRRYSHVTHLESTVVGEISDGRTAYDVLAATFPAGTLSGAPKPRALSLIEHYEPSRRGVYGGVVGYLDFHGDLDMAIAIRTAVIKTGWPTCRRAPGSSPTACPAPSTPRPSTRPQQPCGRWPPRARSGPSDEPAEPTSKAGVVLLALLGAGVLLASGSRTWVTGTVNDAVLGASRISGTGTQVASGVIALALAAAAAGIASTTSGPVVRRLTLALLALAAAGEAFFTAGCSSIPRPCSVRGGNQHGADGTGGDPRSADRVAVGRARRRGPPADGGCRWLGRVAALAGPRRPLRDPGGRCHRSARPAGGQRLGPPRRWRDPTDPTVRDDRSHS